MSSLLEDVNMSLTSDKANFLFIPNRESRFSELCESRNNIAHVVHMCTLLQTVSENARLDVNSPGGDDDFELWDHSGFMLRNDVDDLTNAKYILYFYILHILYFIFYFTFYILFLYFIFIFYFIFYILYFILYFIFYFYILYFILYFIFYIKIKDSVA